METLVMDSENLKTDIEVLKISMSQMSTLISRIDTTIDKLSEVSNGINRMIAVHESRLSQQEDITREIFNIIEQRRVEFNTSMNKLKEEIETEAERSHEVLGNKIDNLAKDIEILNRWRYVVVGAAVAVGAIISEKLPAVLNILGFTAS
jgi:predicted  nucleic acid-binding Zn-ribbon protein